MKYLLLAYWDEKAWEAISAGERQRFEHACQANDELLRRRGHLLAMYRLQQGTVTTLHARHGEQAISAGPLVDSKQPLAALYVIDARDLNHAIAVAASTPQAQHGPVEVRPLVEVDDL
jgi:hypothetical protein